jgi:hypothetical protein
MSEIRKLYNTIEKVQKIINPNYLKEEERLILKLYTKRKKVENPLILDKADYYVIGQLLIIVYFFNLNYVSLGTVDESKNEIIMVNNSSNDAWITLDFYYTKSKDIANEIIRNSVFNTSILRSLKNIDNRSVSKLKEGFRYSYEAIINEKSNILKLFKPYTKSKDLKWICNVLWKLRNGSYEDLKRQLNFIDIFFDLALKEEEFIAMLSKSLDDDTLTLEYFKNQADKLIKDGIVGYHEGKVELTWIIEENNNLIPANLSKLGGLKVRSDFLDYVGKRIGDKYYCKVAEQVLFSMDQQ